MRSLLNMVLQLLGFRVDQKKCEPTMASITYYPSRKRTRVPRRES